MRRISSAMLLAAALAGPAAGQDTGGAGWLGLSWRPAGEVMVVADVFPGSPADEAGLEAGDTVLRWNGGAAAGAAREARPAPGDTVRLRVRRGAERDRDLVVVAEPRPARVAGPRRPRAGERVFDDSDLGRVLRIRADSLRVRADSLRVHAGRLHDRLRVMLIDSLGPRFRELERMDLSSFRDFTFDVDLGARSVAGAEFAEINPGLAEYFGTERGALVLRVAPDTPADRAGLLPGDVVVRAGSDPVASVQELRRALQERPRGAELTLEVVRRGVRVEVRVGR